jgi:hypothetical protein
MAIVSFTSSLHLMAPEFDHREHMMLAVLFLLIAILVFWYDACSYEEGSVRLRWNKCFRLWQLLAVTTFLYGVAVITELLWIFAP